jgi:hypothetical protein
VKISFDTTDISGDSVYYIILDSVRNPDYTFCDPNKWVISVLNTDELQVLSRSQANQMNLPILPYIRNPSEINLRWTYPVDSGVGSDIKIFDVSLGVHAQALSLVPDYGIFMRSFSISSMNSNFNFNPVSPRAMFGFPNLKVTFSANKETTPGLYLIEVIKSDDFGTHTQIPFLKVNVQSQKYNFNLELSEYVVALGGTSLPIIFNISSIAPESDLKVDGSFMNDISGLSFLNTSTILLTADSPIGALYITSDALKTQVGSESRAEFQFFGSNKGNYFGLSPVSLLVVPANQDQPKVFDNTGESPIIGPTFAQVSFTCDVISSMYYYLGFFGSKPRSQLYIKVIP